MAEVTPSSSIWKSGPGISPHPSPSLTFRLLKTPRSRERGPEGPGGGLRKQRPRRGGRATAARRGRGRGPPHGGRAPGAQAARGRGWRRSGEQQLPAARPPQRPGAVCVCVWGGRRGSETLQAGPGPVGEGRSGTGRRRGSRAGKLFLPPLGLGDPALVHTDGSGASLPVSPPGPPGPQGPVSPSARSPIAPRSLPDRSRALGWCRAEEAAPACPAAAALGGIRTNFSGPGSGARAGGAEAGRAARAAGRGWRAGAPGARSGAGRGGRASRVSGRARSGGRRGTERRAGARGLRGRAGRGRARRGGAARAPSSLPPSLLPGRRAGSGMAPPPPSPQLLLLAALAGLLRAVEVRRPAPEKPPSSWPKVGPGGRSARSGDRVRPRRRGLGWRGQGPRGASAPAPLRPGPTGDG